MTRKALSLDDITESIMDLGTLMSDQITELRHEFLGELIGVRDSLSSEISDLRGEMNVRFHETHSEITLLQSDIKLLQNESKAVRSDIKELYDLNAA